MVMGCGLLVGRAASHATRVVAVDVVKVFNTRGHVHALAHVRDGNVLQRQRVEHRLTEAVSEDDLCWARCGFKKAIACVVHATCMRSHASPEERGKPSGLAQTRDNGYWYDAGSTCLALLISHEQAVRCLKGTFI